MKIGKLIMFTALATMLGGCVVAPRTPYQEPAYYPDQADSYPGDSYPDDYYDDYYDTPAYEGFYYVRVIFIGSIPYYVDNDLHIRPIPPRYRSHFSRSRFMQNNRRLPPPRFRRDREMRDGYDTSRIVYMNDVPYVVGSDRMARPLPSHLRPRFRYTPPPVNNRRRQPMQNNRAPADMREREREQNRAPMQYNNPTPYMRERNMPPADNRQNERNRQPAYGRERDQNMSPAYGREPERNMPPAYNRERGQNTPPSMNHRPPENRDAPALMRERREIRQQRQEPQRAPAPRNHERRAPAREKASNKNRRKDNRRDKKDDNSDENGNGRRRNND